MVNKGELDLIDQARVEKLGKLYYYTPEVHRAAFILPAWVERELQML